MASVLLGLYNAIWKTQYIPVCWRTAAVISLLKKGDPLDMDNYRGISLIPVPLKVLICMATQRLTQCLEEKGFLSREQAGFRLREECPGQVAALIEMLQRRATDGLPSYLLFVDLTKAYDTVPHEALFAKMEQHGIRGTMLNFVKALYASSAFRVRLDGIDSAPIPLLRGLRQGCPMSPILFDVFINDLYGKPGVPRPMGVHVPGIPAEEGLVAGLLFADDVAGLAERYGQDEWVKAEHGDEGTELQQQADRVTEWCTTWEMGVGIKKCGVMCAAWQEESDSPKPMKPVLEKAWRRAEVGQQKLRACPPTLCGQPIPVVEEYTYLGLVVNRQLSLEAMAASRRKKANAALSFVRPVLRNQSLPMGIRVSVLNAVVLSSLLYGSEVWGARASLCNKGQTIVNKALRELIGCRQRDYTIPVAALWREVQVPPVNALAAARRVRAVKKYPNLKTWIGTLGKHRHPTRNGRPWYTAARAWQKQHDPAEKRRREEEQRPPVSEPMETGGANREPMPSVVEVRWAEYERRKEWQEASEFYFRQQLGDTSWATIRSIPLIGRGEQVRLGKGFRILSLCRLGALWTTAKRASAKFIDAQYKRICPCCGSRGGETILHLILQCPRWENERALWLGGLLGYVRQIEAVDVEKQLILILGGAIGEERIFNWLPIRKEGSTLYLDEVVTCGAFQVARYLRSIWADRSEIIRQLPQSQSLEGQGIVQDDLVYLDDGEYRIRADALESDDKLYENTRMCVRDLLEL